MKWFLVLLLWSLLASVAPVPAPLLATVAVQPIASVSVQITPRAWPTLKRPQAVNVTLPANLPAPVPGCTRANALYYLETRIDVRGTASAWSCRSLDEVTQYLNFHIGLVTGG